MPAAVRCYVAGLSRIAVCFCGDDSGGGPVAVAQVCRLRPDPDCSARRWTNYRQSGIKFDLGFLDVADAAPPVTLNLVAVLLGVFFRCTEYKVGLTA